jgi:hypothetical protein
MNTMTVKDKDVWTVTEGLPDNVNPSFFDNETVMKIMELLLLLKEENVKIGTDRCQLTTEQILEKYNDHLIEKGMEAIKSSTLYNYLKKARQVELITLKTRTVEDFKEINVEEPSGGKFPPFRVTDVNGNEISPTVIHSRSPLLMSDGEITLKTHCLTRKGKEWLETYLTPGTVE